MRLMLHLKTCPADLYNAILLFVYRKEISVLLRIYYVETVNSPSPPRIEEKLFKREREREIEIDPITK